MFRGLSQFGVYPTEIYLLILPPVLAYRYFQFVESFYGTGRHRLALLEQHIAQIGMSLTAIQHSYECSILCDRFRIVAAGVVFIGQFSANVGYR